MLSALSPRRRRTLLALFAAAVLLAAGLGGTAVLDRSPSAARARAPQDRPGPVLLVPGYGGRVSAFDPLLARLRESGRAATVVALPDGGTGDLRTQARTLDRVVERALRAGAPSVDLVGYSAGGVVVRLWVREHDGSAKARRVVTLGSPQHGTEVAALAVSVVPGACTQACQQLAPGSALLRELNSGDETPAGPAWLSLWTTDDEVVTPPASAALAGAVDVPLQSVCPGLSVGHSALPADPLAVGLTLRALSVAPLRAPTAADCATLRALGGG